MHTYEEIEYRRKDGKTYNPFRRKDKRREPTPIEKANYEGIWDYMTGGAYRNPYPPGKRHNAYRRGFS